MFDDAFRARFAVAVRPAARRLVSAGVTANQLSVAAFALAVAAAALVALGHQWLGLVLWLASRIGDGLDGVAARESGTASSFGGFLDITSDMAAYSLMVLAFAAVHPVHAPAWLAVLAGYVMVITTTLALSGAAGGSSAPIGTTDRTFRFTRGLTEAGETSAIYVLWVVFPSQIWWLAWLWAAALLMTSLQRIFLASRVLR